MLLMLLALLVGCSPSSIGTNETREEPAGAGQAMNPRGEPRVSAAWVEAGTIAITTWGSSSCPTRPVKIERVSESDVEVRVQRTDGTDDCSADAAPTTNQVDLPSGVSTAVPLDVVVHDGQGPIPRLVLRPPPGGR
jgi:hypothetical protein